MDYSNLIKAHKNSCYASYALVLGSGNERAKIMLIGEAPGASEAEQKKPFVGKAGKMLDSFLQDIGLNREDLYLSNVVKIRPCKMGKKTMINRPPSKMEKEFFIPFLLDEIKQLKPKLIISLGNVALNALIPNSKIGTMHGKALLMDELYLFPLFHPAAMIYNQSLIDLHRQDLLKLKELIAKMQI